MRWAGHVAQMGEDKDVGGWKISKWILERSDVIVWIGLIWLRIGKIGGLL
jgi:hypothetical protein